MEEKENPYIKLIREEQKNNKDFLNGSKIVRDDIESTNAFTSEQIEIVIVLIVLIAIVYFIRKRLILIIKTLFFFFFNWIAYLYYLGDRKKQEEKSKLKDLKNM